MLGFYFFALHPFSGAGSVFHQPPLLSVCYDGSLFVFQICGKVLFAVGKEGFPGAGPALVSVLGLTAVKYNKRLICGSVFEFCLTPSVTAVIILARSSQSYSGMAPTSQGGFEVMEVRFSASVL
jgi:hypothetical protein